MFSLLIYASYTGIAFATDDKLYANEQSTPANSTSPNHVPAHSASIYKLSNSVVTESHLSSSNLTRSTRLTKEDETVGVGLVILMAAISFFTIVGNTLVIVSVAIFRKLRRVSNIFLVSLAAADLVMGLFVMPLGAHYVANGKWLMGQTACDIWTSIDVLSVTASICTLCAISIDRYLSVTRPFHHSNRVTRTRWHLIIALIWIVSGLIAFVPIDLNWWKTKNNSDIECYNDPTCCQFLPSKNYAIVSSVISFYIPLFVTIFAYSVVFKIAMEKRADARRNPSFERNFTKSNSKIFVLTRREHRSILTMGLVMGTFVVCWLPFFVANIIQVFCNRCISEELFTILNWLGYTNSFFNPIIFCHSKEFRQAFKQLIECRLCKDGYQQTCRAHLSVSNNGQVNIRSTDIISQINGLIPEKKNQQQKCKCDKSKERLRERNNRFISTFDNTSRDTRIAVNNNKCARSKQVNKVLSNRCDEI